MQTAMNRKILESLFYQFVFTSLVLAVWVGTVTFCFILSHFVLVHFHTPRFWIKMLLVPLALCCIGVILGTHIYLQSKYDTYKKRKREQ
jgi:hypothetical protein